MITRDKNRASVIVWSIGNETPNNPDRETFMEALADHARATDSTRLIAAALLVHNSGDTVVLDDPLGKKLDIASFNEYYGWYTKEKPWEIGKFRFKIDYDKPVFISEVGAEAASGFMQIVRFVFQKNTRNHFLKTNCTFFQQ